MTTIYVHHVPGRLRVRTACLKNDARAAAIAERLMSAVDGVQHAVANPTTGSLTVLYDPAAAGADELFRVLRAHKYIGAAAVPTHPLMTGPKPSGDIAVRLISRLAMMAAEKAVERTLVTLAVSLL